ncbi:MAG: hypothetical protein V4858_17310 [Pseudomonadota bacterium]
MKLEISEASIKEVYECGCVRETSAEGGKMKVCAACALLPGFGWVMIRPNHESDDDNDPPYLQ